MKDNFLDIVAVIVKQMSEDESHGQNSRNIIDGLLDEGYDLMDIDDALSWFESLPVSVDYMGGHEFWPGFNGVRVQARWEREAMTPEAFAYLMKLNGAGLVKDEFRESIVDKIVDLSISGFGVEHMKALLGLVLYSHGRLSSDEPFSPQESGYGTQVH